MCQPWTGVAVEFYWKPTRWKSGLGSKFGRHLLYDNIVLKKKTHFKRSVVNYLYAKPCITRWWISIYWNSILKAPYKTFENISCSQTQFCDYLWLKYWNKNKKDSVAAITRRKIELWILFPNPIYVLFDYT